MWPKVQGLPRQTCRGCGLQAARCGHSHLPWLVETQGNQSKTQGCLHTQRAHGDGGPSAGGNGQRATLIQRAVWPVLEWGASQADGEAGSVAACSSMANGGGAGCCTATCACARACVHACACMHRVGHAHSAPRYARTRHARILVCLHARRCASSSPADEGQPKGSSDSR